MGKFLKQVYKKSSAFQFLDEIKNDGRFIHSVFRAKKLKKNLNSPASQWYVKSLGENRIEALAETLTQEGMRLILPQQPKTRRLIEITPERRIVYSVASRAINYFNDRFFLFPKNYERILDGSITGLAATQVVALWLNEVDFKAGNVGINEHGQVIKLDGGLSFITLNPRLNYLHDKNFRITFEDLEALPNLIHYQSCNWLEHIQWHEKGYGYAKKKEPTELEKRINQNINFKNEVYQTILRIILLPDKLIRFFTQNYITNTADVIRFSNFMIERKQQLENAASKLLGFKEYRLSHQGQIEIFNFLNNLRNFKTMEKLYLLKAFHSQYGINAEAVIIENEISYRLNVLSSELDNSLACLSLEIDTDNFDDVSISPVGSKEIIFYIDYLKNSIKNHLTSSNHSEKDTFYDDLAMVLKKLETQKEDFTINDPVVLHLIESIKIILQYKDHLQIKILKKPIPATINTKKRPSLLPLTFFNEKQPNPPELNQPRSTQSMLSC